MAIDNSFSTSGQIQAIDWLYSYRKSPKKASLARIVEDKPQNTGERAHARALRLQMGTIRHLRLLQHVLQPCCRKKVRMRLECLLLIGLYELLEELQSKDPNPGVIVHSWVAVTKIVFSQRESGFTNAVLRKGLSSLQSILQDGLAMDKAIRYSHPGWLVQRWEEQWGEQETLAFLQWNQSTPSLYFRISGDSNKTLPESLVKTSWKDYYRLQGSFTPEIHSLLVNGEATVQDPATRLAVEAIISKEVHSVLDLCASPGGKTRALDALLSNNVSLTAVDLPDRLPLLKENLSYSKRGISCVAMDLCDPDTRIATAWKNQFDAVLLDAPCSNTGVLQRKPDVKWRLLPEDMTHLAKIQMILLSNAAQWVSPGGYLIYSTCSVEKEENQDRIETFLQEPQGKYFTLISSTVSLPHKTSHDGAGVAVLRKK